MTDYDIVQANAGLIYDIMNKRFYGCDREDLFQEGVKGLLKAYKNYRKNGTTKFSTYAYLPIFGEMYQFATQKQIKVSKDYLRLSRSFESYRYSLAQKRGYIPNNEEIAKELENERAMAQNREKQLQDEDTLIRKMIARVNATDPKDLKEISNYELAEEINADAGEQISITE